MSKKCEAWVWEHSPATGNDRLVLLKIADEADDDGTNAFPSIDRIARHARVNKRTTMRSIQRLEKIGELLVRRPDTYGAGHHNRYAVLMGRAASEVAEVLGWPMPNPADDLLVDDPADAPGVDAERWDPQFASDSRTDPDQEKGDTLSPLYEDPADLDFSRRPRENGVKLSPLTQDKGAERRAQVSPNPLTPPLIDKELLVTDLTDPVENETSEQGDPVRSDLPPTNPLRAKSQSLIDRVARSQRQRVVPIGGEASTSSECPQADLADSAVG